MQAAERLQRLVEGSFRDMEGLSVGLMNLERDTLEATDGELAEDSRVDGAGVVAFAQDKSFQRRTHGSQTCGEADYIPATSLGVLLHATMGLLIAFGFVSG